MKKILALAGVVSTCVYVSQASAMQDERWPRWYVGLSGGVTFLNDTDLSGGATGNMDYQEGGIGTVSLGYLPSGSWQPFTNMRFEVELGYHYNELDSLVLSGTPTPTSKQIEAFSYMANAYYDFRNASKFTPYLGAGAGGAYVQLSKDSGVGNTDSSDNVFAYQFMAGVSYAPQTMPLTDWTLGYRYFVAQEPSFGSAGADIKLDDYQSHSVELGGRFRF